MKNIIPYGKQHITEDDIQSVVDVLKGDYLTQGPSVQYFEESFSKYIGVKYSVAVSNGTAALHLCALAMDIQPGQKVITSPITFAASANCVKYCGGEVEFVDIDPNTYLIDIEKVKFLLESNPPGTFSGIIPVDFSGRAVNLEKLRELANKFGLWIIEDACHAPGGYFIDSNGIRQNCGNGNFADLAIFSFHPVKHIACGEGGMITTNDENLYKKLLTLRTHGIVKDESLYQNSIELAGGSDAYPSWYMEMQTLGYNYRLTDFQAALGNSQLKRADEGLFRRKEIAQIYTKVFEKNPKILGHSGYIEGHAYHLYIIEVKNRLGLYNHLRENGIFAQIHYIPTHLMPYYQKLGWKVGDFKFAELYYSNCISLPMFPTLSLEDQLNIIKTIEQFIL